MRLAIMQPYFMPYIGYFQLINAVDEFVVYDNIEFTKKGWINRNRILANGKDQYITVPLKKDSDYLNVKDRTLAESWPIERRKMLNRINESYRKSPSFDRVFPWIEKSILFKDFNLFSFIFNSICLIREYLEIPTSLVIASDIPIDHKLRAEKKVIEICKARKADTYINSIGGIELYSKNDFKQEGIELCFLKSDNISYRQFDNEFIPWLSVIDVMMFNTKEEMIRLLGLKTLQ
jgi:WbqC-like protein family